jgi:lipoate---protein ligase
MSGSSAPQFPSASAGPALLTYNLPDAALLAQPAGSAQCLVWQPPQTCVVIGRGSKLDTEVIVEHITADAIPVFQRPSGGCAVVLTPAMFVASFVLGTEQQLPSTDYFFRFTHILIRALASLGVHDLRFRGISDIAIGDRKVAGTALYRNRERVFYHAVVNASGAVDLMERYLRHPPRLPDYRSNRPHSEFVTSLAQEGYPISCNQFRAAVEREFPAELTNLLS